jgi:hypothetical protein
MIATALAIAIELIVLVIGIDVIAIRCRRTSLVAGGRQTIGTDRRCIERCRQTLADVLHIDIGDRQVASVDARALPLGLRRNHSVIMFCMLQIIFCRHAIANNTGITRHLQIFFENLMGIATYPRLRAVAVIRLIALAHPTAVLLTTHDMGLALAAPTATANVVALFHHIVTSSFR